MPKSVRLVRLALLIFLTLGAGTARAVIVFGPGTGQNASPPTDPAFQNSGAQFEGGWQVGVGTAIAPQWFLTAKHLGGNVGNEFVLNNVRYTANAIVDDPLGTDLRLVRIAETFASHAQLYTKQNDVTGLLSIHGRGTERGGAVLGRDGVTQQGYQWGAYTGAMSWGANRVSYITTAENGNPAGDFLAILFSQTPAAGVTASATLSSGDSGGGGFIQDTDGVWKLAGVNYAVDGAYSLTPNSGYFNAAMFDQRDFYVGGPGNNMLRPRTPSPDPQSSYLTRVSTRAAWINSVTAVPEPASLALMATGLAVVSLTTKARRARSRRNRVC